MYWLAPFWAAIAMPNQISETTTPTAMPAIASPVPLTRPFEAEIPRSANTPSSEPIALNPGMKQIRLQTSERIASTLVRGGPASA